MAASFTVGYNKVASESEPRFLVLSGNETALQEKVLNVLHSRNNSFFRFLSADDVDVSVQTESFKQAPNKRQQKTLVIRRASGVDSWDWLPIWFNKAKGIRLVVADCSDQLAAHLIQKANTRGYGIDCSAPSSDANRAKFVKLLGQWYNQSLIQLNVLLNQNDWRISECIELLDKLALLKLPLTSDTVSNIGLCKNAEYEFVTALAENNFSLAMTVIPRLTDTQKAVVALSQWVDKLSRAKSAQSYLKPVHEVAFEIGESPKETQILLRQSKKFDSDRINKISLALASADRDVHRGFHTGVLEVLVSKWQ